MEPQQNKYEMGFVVWLVFDQYLQRKIYELYCSPQIFLMAPFFVLHLCLFALISKSPMMMVTYEIPHNNNVHASKLNVYPKIMPINWIKWEWLICLVFPEEAVFGISLLPHKMMCQLSNGTQEYSISIFQALTNYSDEFLQTFGAFGVVLLQPGWAGGGPRLNTK